MELQKSASLNISLGRIQTHMESLQPTMISRRRFARISTSSASISPAVMERGGGHVCFAKFSGIICGICALARVGNNHEGSIPSTRSIDNPYLKRSAVMMRKANGGQSNCWGGDSNREETNSEGMTHLGWKRSFVRFFAS
jgi:hypothetical protein